MVGQTDDGGGCRVARHDGSGPADRGRGECQLGQMGVGAPNQV